MAEWFKAGSYTIVIQDVKNLRSVKANTHSKLYWQNSPSSSLVSCRRSSISFKATFENCKQDYLSTQKKVFFGRAYSKTHKSILLGVVSRIQQEAT